MVSLDARRCYEGSLVCFVRTEVGGQQAALRSVGHLLQTVPDSRQEDNDLDERPFDRSGVNRKPCRGLDIFLFKLF
jgi:hypothetical protein